jgi:hypothetical protein
MRSEHTRCLNDRTRKKSVTERSRGIYRRWLCSGVERFGEPSGRRPEALCRLVSHLALTVGAHASRASVRRTVARRQGRLTDPIEKQLKVRGSWSLCTEQWAWRATAWNRLAVDGEAYSRVRFEPQWPL